MKLSVIDAGNFKLDGGAMFGVVPKTIWQKLIPADENNLCSWKMRCLLIEEGDKLTLIDTGMGNKQSEKWLGYYYRHGDGDLINSIRVAGYHESQITDVILSHLHFDHCGGAVSMNNDKLEITFRNANYWTHSEHWNWAVNPNEREKATFLKENLMPIEESGHLKFIDKQTDYFSSNFSFLYADGHTEKMIMPQIKYGDKKILFIADTIPSFAHIHVPFCMGYDIRPLETMKEKKQLLEKVINEDILVFFDHDINNEVASVKLTERGYTVREKGNLKDFI